MKLQEEERNIAVFRKTILFMFWALTKTIFLLAVPTVVFYYLRDFEIVKIIYYIVLCVTALYFFVQFLIWRFSTLIVTTKRILKTEQKGLLSKTVMEINFKDIYSVNYEIKGFLATIFNYGDLILEIKNSDKKFYARDLPEPSFKRDLILKIKE